jgi:hypothetical protein
VLVVAALVVLDSSARSASAAELTRSADIAAAPATVWSLIGPFCAIRDWHPVVATCSEDGKAPPTRTLVTKDGKTTFVETEVARDETRRTYSYNFVSSPFPVTHYIGTITVGDRGHGRSHVVWHGEFTPLPGRTKDASAAFAGVYEAGLAALKTRFAK